MAIAAEPLSPSGPPSAVGCAAALETSITASAVVISAAIANDDDAYPCVGHYVEDCLHDGHGDVIVDDGLTLSRSPSVVRPVDHMTTMTDYRVTCAGAQ
jgi:hypothetical protein